MIKKVRRRDISYVYDYITSCIGNILGVSVVASKIVLCPVFS